jgi:hypothetical protein
MKKNINQDSKGNVTMKDNLCFEFYGITKILMVKNIYTIIVEDEEIISSLMKR